MHTVYNMGILTLCGPKFVPQAENASRFEGFLHIQVLVLPVDIKYCIVYTIRGGTDAIEYVFVLLRKESNSL